MKNEIPEHLSDEGKAIYSELREEYAIGDSAGLQILRVAVEALDRAQAARRQIEVDGMTKADRWGQIKPHVLLPIERDSRAAFLAGLKALDLDMDGEPAQVGRPTDFERFSKGKTINVQKKAGTK